MKQLIPFSYYGGKANLAQKIIKMINQIPHTLYAEPFCGGAAVFWNKPQSKVEVLNDLNGEVVNFYKVVKEKFPLLSRKIRTTLHSRSQFNDAWVVYCYPHLFSSVTRAWAVFVLANMGFSSQISGSFGFDKTAHQSSKKVKNKVAEFTQILSDKLQRTQIESADACEIIKRYDCETSLFYVDPPYYNSNMGHYKGYTLNDFENLLKVLSNIKGKFILSSYGSEILTQYTELNGWHSWSMEMRVSASNMAKESGKKKVEVFTSNVNLNV